MFPGEEGALSTVEKAQYREISEQEKEEVLTARSMRIEAGANAALKAQRYRNRALLNEWPCSENDSGVRTSLQMPPSSSHSKGVHGFESVS